MTESITLETLHKPRLVHSGHGAVQFQLNQIQKQMNIIEVLSIQRKGKFVAEASDKLAALVKLCRATSKSGALTITLKVKAAMNGEVFVTDSCDQKPPKPDNSATLFYDDENGVLLRDDPRQETLPFETVQNAINE